ncbi:hypothetical protein CcaverHIS002_0404420 [Cutaneotrichosporon cavernicola]|uniref:NADP-dependent oxidoreductase domain-containing protein n=1 Tax=Cutaneotrichosporon cavernicola TaxID=279322 RepID=A0AA48QVR4_9TREE|nr:uncharacterized protein CcaverHIS019_0404400 [Cutaneotrichosporon cavernicola]BEI83838.1 hypothetical protein CcaverHIS002_0404420 [Cutaneotrichosporon cavernicola]BEI91620.1 hypothetical protein CcaverHIS019_0404400 [Cutaneotrichosporon cavernicola]
MAAKRSFHQVAKQVATRTLLLSDGKVIPAIAWGNGTGGLAKGGDRAVLGGQLALEAGIRHLDTAQSYHTEAETTAAIGATGLKRSDVFVTDKISRNTFKGKERTRENVRESVINSLDKLGSKPDLLLIHDIRVPDQGKIPEFWRYLEEMVEDGTLGGVSLGFSNFRPQDIEAVMSVARIKPVVNQVEFHPYVYAHLEPLMELQARHGITMAAFGPLTPILRHPTGGPLKPVLERIGAAHGLDPASVLLLWTVQKGVVAVTSSKSEGNLRKIGAINTLPDLSLEEITAIDEAGKKIHFRFYKDHMTKDFAAPDLPEDV